MTQRSPLQFAAQEDGTYLADGLAISAELEVGFSGDTEQRHNRLLVTLHDGSRLDIPLTPGAKAGLERSCGVGLVSSWPPSYGGLP
jgi:hypothetical protein